MPNEEFFVRRIQMSPILDSGLQLRFEEDEFMKNNTKNPALQQGNLCKTNHKGQGKTSKKKKTGEKSDPNTNYQHN